MSKDKLIIILCAFILFSCKQSEKDKTLTIYHLKPNAVYKNPKSVTKDGWFEVTRNDFFVIKNYDINNEQHKIEIDSFVLNYLKNNDFLSTSKNSNWKLTFFKYGNGINEHTEHIDGTDYAIHNLFSYKKIVCSYYFDTRVGYKGTNYNTNSENINSSKRKIIADYFKEFNSDLKKSSNNIIENPNDISGEYELIKGYTLFIGSENNKILASNLVIEKLSSTDYGFYSAYKSKGISPIGDYGFLRNYKKAFYNLSICENDSDEGISENNFIKGLYLHNPVFIRKKGNKLALISYGGNFRRYMLYKKLNPETNYSIYLETTLSNSKFDYKNLLKTYNRAKKYDKNKLEITNKETNNGWVTSHTHKEGSISFNKTYYYQDPFQDGMFVKQDSVFFELLK